MKNARLKINTSLIVVILLVMSFIGCANKKNKKEALETQVATQLEHTPFFKISLAQWSLHRAIMDDKTMSPFEFAKETKALGFEAVEYVTQLYTFEIEKLGFETVIDSLKNESEKYDVKNLLIMVDGEGDLADPNVDIRDKAVENHKKWVDAAAYMGCHSIRVNTFGTMDPDIWVESVKDGLIKLSKYAASKNINVLVENHGWWSSDPLKVMQVINEINMPNCGTLPDFGNWCYKRSENYFDGECLEEFPDKYEGIKLMMPAAKAVSAKSSDFDEKGNETRTDFLKMLQIIKDSGYKEYISVEYNFDDVGRVNEKSAIILTKKLLINASKHLD